MKTRLWIVPLMALLWASPLISGVVYEIEVTDHEQSPPKSETIQAAVEGRNLTIGPAPKGRSSQGTMIFRGDRRQMVIVDHENRNYTVMDEEAIGQMAGQVNQAMSRMQEALKNVPADKRAMVEQMMKQRMPNAQAPETSSRSELKKTGDRASHNGYPCVKYEVLREGRKTRELWVTDWSNIEGGTDVVDAFQDMSNFFREMTNSIPNMGGGRGGPAIDEHLFERLNELGGFPVVTKDFGEDGSLKGETAFRSAKRQTIDPDAFEPPSGYKRQEMFPGR